ncbi:CENP-B protein 2 [Pleurostoma richardsiae]|uniref:CENP-B protein 2 n=1 Tax=Pleurostoma richardsiae TaxID=41990 RepID=A0AA38R414_9PEZI|nr:CENP-B protein 2 [Pleurostoma richardsiae]
MSETGPGIAPGLAPGLDPSLTPDVTPGATPVKERHSLTLDQRRALRRWANSQTVRPSHKACIEWFQSQYNQTISQSTVSHSLSPKYARLDGDPQLSGSRLRFGNWPDVEKLVLLWHQSMVNQGRQPSNEELAEKAKSIFTQLPRYKDEQAPEFSPGWIHRFKKRYGLLIRRQRRHGSAPNPAEDLPYLVDTVPRFMSVSAETSPAAIRDSVARIVGVEPSLATCARVRDEIMRRLENPQPHSNGHLPPNGDPAAMPDGSVYQEEDPEAVLQDALRRMQQEEAEAEAEAAAVREEQERAERGLPPLGTPLTAQAYAQQAAASLATPVPAARTSVAPPNGSTSGARYSSHAEDLTLTPIPSGGPISVTDRPVRCPFCVNQRMLRTIKEAVEHLSTHVVV